MTNLEKIQLMLNKQVPAEISPTGHWLGYVATRAEFGEIEIELTSRPEMANPAGMVQGGIITTICDDAMGVAHYSTDPEHYVVTVDINVNFLYGIPVGDKIRAIGRVEREGKKITFVSCSVFDAQNRLCALATSNLITTSVDSPEEYAKDDK